MTAFVLVHSPLVGPATWSWVASELRKQGHGVVVPSLVEAATAGSWEACVGAVAAAAPPAEPSVLVGHSGAGPLLPPIAAQLHASMLVDPATMETLVPDPARRAAVVAEIPRLPLSYFHARIPVPEGWDATPCGYVLLSEAYRQDAEVAAARGWPVTELPGSHLDPVTSPAPVAEALDAMICR